MSSLTKTLAFRPATPDDAAFAADVWTAVRPSSPSDPLVTRYEWETATDNWIAARYIAERDSAPVGVAVYEHPRWELTEQRWAFVAGDLFPYARAHLADLVAAMEERAAADGATLLRTWAIADDQFRIDTLLARGFREDRRGKRWELDLVANRRRLEEMAEASRARMRREGIQLLTLAADRDPKKYEKIWRMSEEAAHDVPTTIPHVEETLEDYMKWFRSPDMREDRFWLAREGDGIVGVSVLTYPPVRGIVGTAWTATARSVRGRGVARALKCETVMQAIALGVDRVRTGNDAKNDPILHINETMGYREIPGGIQFMKDV